MASTSTERAGPPSPGARYATRGMVASRAPAAAAAGLQVLLAGGNAFDAAITTALVEGLALPASCGLGGDAFAVVYEAKSGRVHAVNGSGGAPLAANREYFVSRGHNAMPLDGIHSVSVPGAPHAYWSLHERFGSLPWADVVAPAIAAAEDGIAVAPHLAREIASAQSRLAPQEGGRAEFFPDGASPRPGSVLRRPGYARSLRRLAEDRATPFYEGEIAREIVRCSEALGGLFTLEDFARHTTEIYEPLRTTYRDVEVCVTAPPSQGLIVLECLNLLEGFDLAASGFGTAKTIHLMVEAKKLAFADRLRYAGDPRMVDVPLAELISKPFAERRRRSLDPRRAADSVPGTTRADLHGDTSSFCVADGQGNAVSFIHSLSAGWGSGVVGGNTGIVLNNRAGRGFTLEEGHANVIAGGKRTMHTLTCYLLLRNGQFYAVGGTPGGDRQPQWNVQTITDVVDFGMDPQQAVEAPRWESFPGTDPEHFGHEFDVRLEGRFSADTRHGLEALGHRVVERGAWSGGGAVQTIARTGGVLIGGSDPRAAGVAIGY